MIFEALVVLNIVAFVSVFASGKDARVLIDDQESAAISQNILAFLVFSELLGRNKMVENLNGFLEPQLFKTLVDSETGSRPMPTPDSAGVLTET